MISSTAVVSSGVEATAGLAALADPVRLAIVGALADGEQCVCELRERVPVAENLLSYHLRVLREAALVVATRRGRWVDYRLDGEGFAALWASLGAAGVPLSGETVATERGGPSCSDEGKPA